MPDSDCPNRDQLYGYLVGKLPTELAEEVSAHLETCHDCQTSLKTLNDAEDSLIGRLAARLPPDPYSAEPQYQELLLQARAVVGEPSSPGGKGVSDVPSETRLPDTLGEYEVLERLGEGGMGAVYKAKQAKLKRMVALKVLRRGRMLDETARARFEREMEAVGAVDHPNIVRAMDAREIEGTPVLVTEYVDGLDLSRLAQRLGPLRISDACELIRQAALGLQCAHDHGLVHRDIKPGNLMLTRDGTVKVLDLGLALLQSEQSAGAEITNEGQPMGTPDYMAPEQVTDSHNVDVRADIYGLGCTLYRLLAGRAPFSGWGDQHVVAKMMGHVQGPVPSIRDYRDDVPDGLVAILDRMLAKAPDDRYGVPRQVADALDPFAGDSELAALAAKADKREKLPGTADQGVDTDEYASSPAVGTKPSVRPGPVPPAARLRRKTLALLIGMAAVLMAAATFIYLKTGEGTLVLEVKETDVKVTIDGKQVQIKSPRDEITVIVGPHELEVTKDGFHTFTDSFTVRRRGGKVGIVAQLLPKPPPSLNERGPILFEVDSLPAPSSARAADVGDLNGDRILDVVCGYGASPEMEQANYVYWGRGSRRFELEDGFGRGTAPFGMKVADFNGDSKLDVLVLHTVTEFDSELYVNVGDGFEARRVDLAPGSPWGGNGCQGLAVGDLDDDGDMDAVSGHRGGFAYLSVNDGRGNFTSKQLKDPGAHDDIEIGDLDGDGHLEIVDSGPIGGWSGPSAIYWNAGDGTFRESTRLHAGRERWGISLGDMDGDGDLDIAMGTGDGEPSAIYRNERGRQFVLHSTFPSHRNVLLADLDGDGKAELITGGIDGSQLRAGRTLHVYWECTRDGLVDKYELPGSFGFLGLRSIVAADLDGDGVNDLFVGGESDRNHILWGKRSHPDGVDEGAHSFKVDEVGSGQVIYAFGRDGQGRSCLCYHGEADGTLCIASKHAGTWQKPLVVSASLEVLSGADHAFALGRDGLLRVAYKGEWERDQHALKYAEREPSNDWKAITVPTASGSDLGFTPSLWLDEANRPHVAHWCFQGSPAHTLLYTWFDGEWHTESTGHDAGGGPIVLDSEGYPHIAGKTWSTTKLNYLYKDKAGWHLESVSSSATWPRLVLDRSDNPHVVARRDKELWHFFRNDAGWQEELIADFGGVRPLYSLAVDSSAGVHVAYGAREGDALSLKYAYRTPHGSWTTQTVYPAPTETPWQSICLELFGDQPAIAFTDGHAIYYATAK